MECTITPNPDIAGVGVRVAIYLQAFLGLIPSVLAVWKADDESRRVQEDDPEVITVGGEREYILDKDDLKELGSNSITILLMGISLLISSFIQERLYGLTLYHALIVLNLSWLNNITASLSMNLSAIMQTLTSIASPEWTIVKWQAPLYVAHFCLMAGFGISVFAHVDTFGGNGSCNSQVLYYLFGHSISATSTRLRTFSLVEYGLSAAPGINALLLGLFVVALAGIAGLLPAVFIRGRLASLKAMEVWFLVMAVCLDILLIVGTEGIVYINRNSVGEGEGDWTFGQTLSMLLLVIPFLDAVSKFRAVLKEKREKKNAGPPTRAMDSGEQEQAEDSTSRKDV